MNRIFIQIPIKELSNTQREYYALTRMKIPDKMSVNEAGTHYLTGELKTHFSSQERTDLKLKISGLIITDGWPENWITKEEGRVG